MENEKEEISSQVESNESKEQLNKKDNPPAEKIVYVRENSSADNQANSKTGVGVALGLLGLIGLVIGLCLYTEKLERESFIKGWVIMFVIEIFLCIIFGIMVACNAQSAYNDIYRDIYNNNIY